MLVDIVVKKRNLVKECVECAEWAQPFAERTVEQHAENYNRGQYSKFPSEERSEHRPNTAVGK